MSIQELIAIIIFMIYITSIIVLICESKKPLNKEEKREIEERRKHLEDE